MGIFNDLKEFVSDKYMALRKAIKDYRLEKKEEHEISEMQYLLHVYFDLMGMDLSKEQIMKVNNYLKNVVVISGESEISNFRKFALQMTTISGGLEALEQDRAQVMEKLESGKVISKTDACVVAKQVIINQPRIACYHYDENNNKVEQLVREENTFAISINDAAGDKDGIQLEKHTPKMNRAIEMFQDVKAKAFPRFNKTGFMV